MKLTLVLVLTYIRNMQPAVF